MKFFPHSLSSMNTKQNIKKVITILIDPIFFFLVVVDTCLNSLFENMDRILDDNYIPTPTDVLRARVRTNGIIETNFRVNDTIIR